MKYKHSLRIRITVTFFLFVTVLMVSVAAGVYNAIESIEERVVEETLEKELRSFQKRYQTNPDEALPSSASMTAYLIEPGEENNLPVYIRNLDTGTYEIQHDDQYMQIIVGNLNGKKLALELDATLFEQRERDITHALIIAIIIASLVSLWIGYGLSQRAIAPVTNLARSVSVLEPGKPATGLAKSYVNDEVGELAVTFDRYLERMQDFIAREQEFTGNASHELRTPLTIIKGAVEILGANPELTDKSQKVLLRIKRAADTMSQMVDTLLILAREDRINEEPINSVSSVSQTILTENNDLLGDKPVKLELKSIRDFGLEVPQPILIILLGNLLRNAIAYTKEGSITITVNSPTVLVTDTGKGITAEALPQIFNRHYRDNDNESAGSGIGLSIVKRICEHYGWQIKVDSTPAEGTVVSVDFTGSNIEKN